MRRTLLLIISVCLSVPACSPQGLEPSTPAMSPTAGQPRPEATETSISIGESTLVAEATQSASATARSFVDTYGFEVLVTGIEEYPYVVLHQDGEKLIPYMEMDEDSGTRQLAGAAFLSSEGESFVVFLGQDGLPETVVAGEDVFVLSNYTDNTVDIAMLGPEGVVTPAQGIPVDPDLLRELGDRAPQIGSRPLTLVAYRQEIDSAADTIRYSNAIVGLAACGIATFAAGATAGLAVPVALLTCGSALGNLLVAYYGEDSHPALQYVSGVLSLTSCGAGSFVSCAQYLAGFFASRLDEADSQFAERLRGNWEATDPGDRSRMTLNLVPAGHPIIWYELYDDWCTACSGAPCAGGGDAEFEGRVLRGEGDVSCLRPASNSLWAADFPFEAFYDPFTDTLTDATGAVWRRQ